MRFFHTANVSHSPMNMAHLLLRKSGISMSDGTASKHRNSGKLNPEERLCDQIAAEILMPRPDFEKTGHSEGWTLKSLRKMAAKYDTSMEATSRRMVDLMPEPSILGVWKCPKEETPTLKWPHSHTPQNPPFSASSTSYKRTSVAPIESFQIR